MENPPRTRLEPRRFVSSEMAGWNARLKTAIRWSAFWSVVKVITGMATGGWALVADGISGGAELMGTSFVNALGKKPQGKTGRILLKVITVGLLFTAGVLIVRIGFSLILQPKPLFPVLYLVVAASIMAGQFITARFVASKQQMATGHVPIYRILAGNVLSSVLITLTAAVCNVASWQQADVFLTLAIGVITILKAGGVLRDIITELIESPETEPGMMDVAAVLCSHPLVVETHSLRLGRGKNGVSVLHASVVLDRDQFAQALEVKSDLERKVKVEFGVTRLDLRYELKPGPEAKWKGRAIFDQFMMN